MHFQLSQDWVPLDCPSLRPAPQASPLQQQPRVWRVVVVVSQNDLHRVPIPRVHDARGIHPDGRAVCLQRGVGDGPASRRDRLVPFPARGECGEVLSVPLVVDAVVDEILAVRPSVDRFESRIPDLLPVRREGGDVLPVQRQGKDDAGRTRDVEAVVFLGREAVGDRGLGPATLPSRILDGGEGASELEFEPAGVGRRTRRRSQTRGGGDRPWKGRRLSQRRSRAADPDRASGPPSKSRPGRRGRSPWRCGPRPPGRPRSTTTRR